MATRIATADARRGLVVVNPTAGAVTAPLVDAVVTRCEKWLDAVEVSVTTSAADARDSVAGAVHTPGPGPRLHAVVAVGGDGTARAVAEGLARGLGRWPAGAYRTSAGAGPASPAPALVVVAAGTGNSCHRALWGDRPWTEVVDEALGRPESRVRELDLARLVEGDVAILLGASTGFIAMVTEVALREFATVPGRERYHRAMAAVLPEFAPYPGRVLVDDVPLHEGPTMLVTLGGARHRVGTFEVLPRSLLDDGLLDVCVVDGGLSPTGRIEVAALAATGQHLGHPAVRYGQGRRVTIERCDGEPLLVEHDGEVRPGVGTRATMVAVPGAVPVFAPEEPVAG